MIENISAQLSPATQPSPQPHAAPTCTCATAVRITTTILALSVFSALIIASGVCLKLKDHNWALPAAVIAFGVIILLSSSFFLIKYRDE